MSESIGKCPVIHKKRAAGDTANEHWWPENVSLRMLHQNPPAGNPLADFQYRAAVKELDVDALTRDVDAVMTDSQPWWPADFGHYGPFFIRMTWHSAGSYRQYDGRGGSRTGGQRFAPLNSWPDNANLDKARRLLWPIKQKYGAKLSWADLMVFAGNRAFDAMGLPTLGFSFGRTDIYDPPQDIYWGPETGWKEDERHTGAERHLINPLGAVVMGLIYVNPEGPLGEPDPVKQAHDVRQTFANMGMNDVETAALTIGGHSFGKSHGAAPEDKFVGREPEGAAIEEQQFGWTSSFKTGKGPDTTTSGIEGAWTWTPTKWDMSYLEALLDYDWEVVESPAGAKQWRPTEASKAKQAPDAHRDGETRPLMMTTADMALKADPDYLKICKRFRENPEELAREFAKAWYKLLHRDMGPKHRYVGPLVPEETFKWQDPLPAAPKPSELIGDTDIAALKEKLLASSLSTAQLVRVAWASASTFRGSDLRGGANGARVRLAPQNGWAANDPAELKTALAELERVRAEFGADKVSLADTIVLGGVAAVEKAAKEAGHPVTVPFRPGRVDASEEQTDAGNFECLEPKADGFRNFWDSRCDEDDIKLRPESRLIDRAQQLTLTAPEMTALVGGLRVLEANTGGSKHGVLTERPGQLTTDFFVNLLDMKYKWEPQADQKDKKTPMLFDGRVRSSGDAKWTATRVDLMFGSHSQLRALTEVYAGADAGERFVKDFVAAWDKVMSLDRFDLEFTE